MVWNISPLFAWVLLTVRSLLFHVYGDIRLKYLSVHVKFRSENLMKKLFTVVDKTVFFFRYLTYRCWLLMLLFPAQTRVHLRMRINLIAHFFLTLFPPSLLFGLVARITTALLDRCSTKSTGDIFHLRRKKVFL